MRERHARAGVPSHFPMLATPTSGTLDDLIGHGFIARARYPNFMLDGLTPFGPLDRIATAMRESPLWRLSSIRCRIMSKAVAVAVISGPSWPMIRFEPV